MYKKAIAGLLIIFSCFCLAGCAVADSFFNISTFGLFKGDYNRAELYNEGDEETIDENSTKKYKKANYGKITTNKWRSVNIYVSGEVDDLRVESRSSYYDEYDEYDEESEDDKGMYIIFDIHDKSDNYPNAYYYIYYYSTDEELNKSIKNGSKVKVYATTSYDNSNYVILDADKIKLY